LNRALSCIRAAIALAAIAVIASGCAAANNATSAQASAQGETPYKTMYGLSSEGTTTDLYTEFFGSSQPTPAATTVAAAQPAQPISTQPITPAQQNATATNPTRPGQAATTNRQNQNAANRATQPAAVQPAQVAQQPAPAPPQEPDVPTVYGITANGPTTDLYTEIFGPRRKDAQ
jgi:hypothetical protein